MADFLHVDILGKMCNETVTNEHLCIGQPLVMITDDLLQYTKNQGVMEECPWVLTRDTMVYVQSC